MKIITKRKIWVLGIVGGLVGGLIMGQMRIEAGGEISFYVSPSGSDSNPGTINRPFKTINRAQQKVRLLLQQGVKSKIVVYLRQGTYELQTPLLFDERDSGREGYPIIYQAFPGETAVISGGTLIKGQWHNEGGSVWSIVIPEVKTGQWWFRNLFRNGQRLPRGEWPNFYQGEDILKVKSVSKDWQTITVDKRPPLQGNVEGKGVELVSLYQWHISRTPVRKIEGKVITTSFPVGFKDLYWAHVRVGDKLFLEHSQTFMDKPGEWYLDKQAGKLYYLAEKGENPNEKHFWAPRLEKLMVVKGKTNKKVENLHFRNLVFAYSDWQPPQSGYNGIQAGHYFYNNRAPGIPTAIWWENVKNSSFTYNRVTYLGTGGFGLGMGTSNISIDRNEFYDIGANCVYVGDISNYLGVEWPKWVRDSGNVPINIRITNNDVRKCGQVFFGAVGIEAAYTQHVTISHNLVTDLPYTGISVTSKWQAGKTSQREAEISFNKVYDVVKVLADGGGIYTTGFSPNSVIKNNLVFDVRRSKYAVGSPNNGIYLDQASSFYTIENNVTYNISGNDKFFHDCCGGGKFVWKNNYWGVSPDKKNFPKDLVANVGPILTPTPTPSVPPSSTPSPIPSVPPSSTPQPSGSKVGDINQDGRIDDKDLKILVNNFGKVESEILNKETDIDGNGMVDIFDYSILVSNWGR